MKITTLGGIVLALASAPAFGSPCVSGTLASYIALPTGCTIGLFTFQNFAFTIPLNVGVLTPLTASDIAVSVVPTAGFSGLSYAAAYSAIGSQAITYEIDWAIDPPPPILHAFELDMFTNTPVAPGTADITSSLCVGALFVGVTCSGTATSVTVFHHGSAGSMVNNLVTFAPNNILGIHTSIALDGHTTGSSSFTSFSASSVPEPATWLGVGGGLLMVFLRRRRRR